MKSAESVKKIRLAFCMERSEFAQLVGVSRHTIYQYEKGLRQPKLRWVRKLLEVAKKKKMEMSIEDFLE